MHFNGLKHGGALKEFSVTSQFLGLKMQTNYFLKKIRVLSAFLKKKKKRITDDFKPV